MICRPGTSSINKPNAGWPQAALPLWLTICSWCCEKRKAGTDSPRRRSLRDARCNRRRKVAVVQAMTEPSGAKAVKCMPLLIRRGNLQTLLVTPANEQDRAQVGELATAVQDVTGQSVELAFVDQGYTGDDPAAEARQHGIQLEVINPRDAQRAC